jgi:hypothetical protein
VAQALWILTSEDIEGTAATYGAFSTHQKGFVTLMRLLEELDLRLWTLQTGEQNGLRPEEVRVISCTKDYTGDDPEMDFAATTWELRKDELDRLAD